MTLEKNIVKINILSLIAVKKFIITIKQAEKKSLIQADLPVKVRMQKRFN